MTIVNEKVQALLDLKKGYDDAVKVQGEAAVKSLIAEFFAANPTIEAVKWTQYTPYFNDGDPCVFHVGETYARVDGVEGDDDDGFTDSWSLEGAPKEAIRVLGETLGSLEDVLEVVFGDHAEVIATRDELRVEEYDHD